MASDRRSVTRLIVALILAVLAFQLGVTMVTPVINQMSDHSLVDAAQVATSQKLFFLSGGLSCLVCVRLSDRFGRRPLLLAILLAAIAGALVIAVWPSAVSLFAGRFLQGSASAVFPLVYLLLREAVSEDLFGPAVGIVSAFSGGLFGVDGLVGGALGDGLGFRAVFAALAVLGLIAFAACWAVVPSIRPSGGVARFGWRSALDDIRLLRDRSVWSFLGSTLFAIAGAFAIMTYVISLLAQDPEHGFRLNSTATALVFLVPAGLVPLVAAPLSGRLAPRLGWARMLKVGLVGSVVALAFAALFTSQFWVVFAAMVLLGLFFNGTVLPMVNGLSVLLTPHSSPGLLPAMNGLAVGVGGSLGVALVAPLVAAGSTAAGYSGAFWLCGGLIAVSSCFALLIRMPQPHAPEASKGRSTAARAAAGNPQ